MTARAEGAFAEYAQAFTQRGERLAERGQSNAAIDAWVEAALIYEEELEDQIAAAERYRGVLEIRGDHKRSLFALGLLYHDLGRWDDLIALYRGRLSDSLDDGERTTLHLYIAELLSERKENDNAAFEEVVTAARLAPQNLRIITRLEHLGERTQRLEEVAVVLGDLILHQEDAKIRAALSWRLAELHLGPLNNPQRALAYLRSALMDDGGNPEILSEVEDAFRERARFDQLAAVLEEVTKDRREGPHVVRLERELARIYELELDDSARAMAAMVRGLKHTPEDREMLDEVMRLGLIGGDLAGVAETFEWVCGKTDNTLLKTYLRLKLGHIYANVLGQHQDAVRVYWSILEEEPSHKEARRRLIKLHERRDEFTEVAQLLEQEASELPAEEAIESWVRVATLYRRDIKDFVRSRAFYERVLETEPAHSEALRGLSKLDALAVKAPPTDDLVLGAVGSSVIESRSDEQPTEFEGVFGYGPEDETQFAATVDQRVDKPRKVRKPRASSAIGISDDAVESVLLVESEVPQSLEAQGEISEVPGAPPPPVPPSEFQGLVSTLDVSFDSPERRKPATGKRPPPMPPPDDELNESASSLVVPLGSGVRPPPPPPIEDEETARVEGDLGVAHALGSTVSPIIDPREPIAPEPQAPISRSAPPPVPPPDFDEDETVAVSDFEPLSAANFELSVEEEPILDSGFDPNADLGEALEVLQGLGEPAPEAPNDAGALQAPPRPVVEAEEEPILSASSMSPAPSDRVELPVEPSRSEDLQSVEPPAEPEPSGAVEPQSVDAQMGAQFSALFKEHEAEVRQAAEEAEMSAPDSESQSGASIEDVFVDESSEALDVQSEAIADSEPEAPVEASADAPIEALIEAPAAEQIVEPAVESVALPDMAPIAAPVASPVASKSGAAPQEELQERLVKLQQELQEATRLDNKSQIVELLERVVGLTEQLGQHERAFFSMVRLVQLEPNEARLDDAFRLGRAAEGYPLLIDTVQGALEQPELEAHRVNYGLKLAEIELGDLKDLRAALLRLEALEKLEPNNTTIFERLVALLEEGGRFADLARVLSVRAERVEEPKESLGLILQAAEVARENAADPALAAKILVRFVERSPEQEEARWQAIELLEELSQHETLARVLEGGMERQEGQERAQSRLRIAQLYFGPLGRPEDGEAMLREGLAERARDTELLVALENYYEDEARYAELVDIQIRRLDVLKKAKSRAALHRKIAQVAEMHLGNQELALDMLLNAAAEDPSDLRSLDELERLRRERGSWEGVLEVLLLKIKAQTDHDERAQTLVSIADIRANVYNDLKGAQEALHDALAIAPRHSITLAALAEVEELRGDVNAAIAALRRLQEVCEGPERALILVRIGRLYAERLDDQAEANVQYEAAHEADPTCLEALLALLPLAEQSQDYTRGLDLAVRAAELTEDEREQANLWRRAGQIAHEAVGDERRALEYYERALAIDSDDLATHATVGQLLKTRGDHQRAYPHLIKAADELSDPARAAELYRDAGLAAQRIHSRDDAVRAFEAALKRAPTMFEALLNLSELLELKESWERLYEVGASLILHHEHALAGVERAPVYLRMARAKRGLDDKEAAIRLAQKAHQFALSVPGPLELLAELLEEGGEPFEAAECLRKLTPLLKEPDKKREALVKAARLLAEEAGDLARACALLFEAQTSTPEDTEVGEMLARYRAELGEHEAAAQALAICARLKSGKERADLLVRAARLAAVQKRSQAKSLLQEAVEILPAHRDGLGDLAVMLEYDGETKALAELYERAAHTLLEGGGHEDLGARARAIEFYERAMWLYRYRLDAPSRALQVNRLLMKLTPDDERYLEEHARLLEDVAQRADGETKLALEREAQVAWSQLVERHPGLVEGVRRLAHLSHDLSEKTLARVYAELLEQLGEDVQPLNPLMNGESRTLSPPKQSLTIPTDPIEKSPLKPLLTGLGYGPLKVFPDLLPEPRPKKRDLVGPAGLGLRVGRPLQFVAAALGQKAPPVYVREDLGQAVSPYLAFDQPALLVSLAQAEKHSEEELRFLLGRALWLLQPRALAVAVSDLGLLRETLMGFARIEAPLHRLDAKQAKKRGRALEKGLPAAARPRLNELVQTWIQPKSGVRASLGDERAAVYRAAERVGLVASGGLSASVSAMKSLCGGRVERSWHMPMLRFVTTRPFAELMRSY